MNIVMLEWSYELLEMFYVDIMKLYISALDHSRKLKFSNYVHLPSTNKISKYRYAWVILCNVGEVYIFELGCYILALEHDRKLWL